MQIYFLTNKQDVLVNRLQTRWNPPPSHRTTLSRTEALQPSTHCGTIYCIYDSNLIINFEDDASVWVLKMMAHPTKMRFRIIALN